MAISGNNTQEKKKWPRYAFMVAIFMAVVAVVLYFWMYQKLNREFSPVSDYYGAQYEELFALRTPNRTMKEELLQAGEAAMKFVGSEAEAEKENFGALTAYCVTQYPDAKRVGITLEDLAGDTEGDKGYLWVAYTRRIYDAQGNLLSASGSEEARILARWEAEKINGTWQVTEILEHSEGE